MSSGLPARPPTLHPVVHTHTNGQTANQLETARPQPIAPPKKTVLVTQVHACRTAPAEAIHSPAQDNNPGLPNEPLQAKSLERSQVLRSLGRLPDTAVQDKKNRCRQITIGNPHDQ